MNKNQNLKKGQILIITLLVLTILSILTVSLIILNNRDVTQTVNTEVYQKVYNSSETKLKEVLGVVADPNKSLSSLSTQYTTCINQGGSILTYACNFTLPSDSDPTITYTDQVTVSNEKDIVDFPVSKDRPLTLNLVGYSNGLRISTNKATALDFTLIYLQGGTYQTFSGVYDPSTATYTSTDPVFKTYINPDPIDPLGFTLRLPPIYNSFQLLSITPRLQTANDSVLMTVKAIDLPTYPAQVRKFVSQAYTSNDTDSPIVKIVTQIPLSPQTDGLLDYSLLTPDLVQITK